MIGSRRQAAYPPCDAPEDLLDQWIEYLNFLMRRTGASMIRDSRHLKGIKMEEEETQRSASAN